MCIELDRNTAATDFGLILGNVEFFNGKIESAKKIFNTSLRRLESEPNQLLEGYIFNNLAFASWMHLLELKLVTDEELKNKILRDENMVMTYLKRSIELQETFGNPACDYSELN